MFHKNNWYIHCIHRDVEIFLDMPVIWTNFENFVSPNNKICSRNIYFLSVGMKFCQSNHSVWHFLTSLHSYTIFQILPIHILLGKKDIPLIYFWSENYTHTYTLRPEKYTPIQPHVCILYTFTSVCQLFLWHIGHFQWFHVTYREPFTICIGHDRQTMLLA